MRLLIRSSSPSFIPYLRSLKVRKRDMVKVAIATSGTAVGLVALPAPAEAVILDFSDFSDTSSLTLNGSATQVDNLLRLTADTQSQTGSAFITNPFSITADTSFSTRFDFWLTGDGFGGDGFTFMIHNDPLGNKALGGGGEGLGYSGISPSLAIEFDTFSNPEFGDPGGRFNLFSSDHIGVNINGSITSETLVNLAGVFELDQDGIFTANIDYNGLTNRLDISITNGETTLSELSPTIDLFDLVGSQAYFGFSAATGFESNNHDILNWTLDTDALPLPEPIERTFEFSGTFGEDIFDNLESFNGDSFTGSYSFFTNTPDLNDAPEKGTYALSDLTLTLLDSETGDETDLVFDATTEAFVDLDSYIVRVRPARVNRRRAPRASFAAFSSGFDPQAAAVENPDSQTCSVEFTDPDRVSFVLTYDDELPNPDLPPTGPPQGNLILSETFFEFYKELSGADDLCLIDRVQVAEVEVTDPNSNPDPDPEPVPEPGTALGLGMLGLGWGLRKRFGRAKG
jgi:hypothetical protein